MKNDDIKRRLLQRTDVAAVDLVGDSVVVTDKDGRTSPSFDTFSDAVGWLVGADEHLVGMAVCPCMKCLNLEK